MKEKNSNKIGVVMGGVSSEREISLKSGNAVLKALLNKGLNAVAIDITSDKELEVKKAISNSGINLAFIALHGYFGEDGKIQKILDEMEILYTGSGMKASRLSIDKIESKKIIEKKGFKTPAYRIVNSRNDLSGLDLKYPLVVKPSTNGSSIGMSLVSSKEFLVDAFNLAKKYDENIIVEEFIKGREFTVGILGEEALPVVEIIPKNKYFDYEAKYQKGLTDYVVPAKISQNLYIFAQRVGLETHRMLGCSGISRVDMILKDDEFFVLELNSIPGMTETSLLPKAAKSKGISFDELCMMILNLSLNGGRSIDVYKKK